MRKVLWWRDSGQHSSCRAKEAAQAPLLHRRRHLFSPPQGPSETSLPREGPPGKVSSDHPVPSPTGPGQQGEETLHRRLSGDREVPAGTRDLCGRLPSQQPLGTGENCLWGQGTGQNGGGLCEYEPLPRPLFQPQPRTVSSLFCVPWCQGLCGSALASSGRGPDSDSAAGTL